jgi:hypothetical protein
MFASTSGVPQLEIPDTRRMDFPMFARLRCFLRDHHNPARHPLGGFKCSDCGAAGADLEDMGFEDAGYVLARRSRGE